jgi:hypothetical protein
MNILRLSKSSDYFKRARPSFGSNHALAQTEMEKGRCIILNKPGVIPNRVENTVVK